MISRDLSQWMAIVSGVPQGLALGPVLFICYINDMPDTIKLMLFMYADDMQLTRQVDNEEDAQSLEEDVNKLVEWLEKWQLHFNIQKCKVMHFGAGNSKASYKMKHSH